MAKTFNRQSKLKILNINVAFKSYILTKVTILLYATNLLVLGTLEKKSFVLSPSMARMGG